jgi:antitoxin MazE
MRLTAAEYELADAAEYYEAKASARIAPLHAFVFKQRMARLPKRDYNVSTWISLEGAVMRLQIGKWGNSLAVRLPVSLTQQAMLKEGDVLEAELGPNGALQLSPVHSFDKSAFLAELDKLHESLPRTESVIEIMRQEQRY